MTVRIKMLAMQSLINDDIYTGYNDYPSIYSTKDLDQDELFQEALQTSYAKRSIVSDCKFFFVLGLNSDYTQL